MVTLRLSQSAGSGGRHGVVLRLDGVGAPVEAATEFEFAVSAADAEQVRWYLEDFLEYPLDPAPEVAARVERRLAHLGTSLFASVFDSDPDARDVWGAIRGRLASVRVEVSGTVDAAAVLPWELLRDPRSGNPLALQVDSFVRVNSRPAIPTQVPGGDGDRLRVLLVICRPGGDADVPFRSVARHLTGLGDQARGVLELDVLRPPTYARLAAVLEAASQAGRPYHVVHFDGHGAYVDSADLSRGGGPYGPLRFGLLNPARPGRHGYLVFEDPNLAGNQQLVDGPALGALLARCGVSVLLLNACRSAYAEAPTEPVSEVAEGGVHGQVRAYGSLALEASDAGLPGVVAMRYNVYVVTAAQFVADLYAALLAGQPLGAAVSAGRRQLAAQPNRSIAFAPIPLQDWSVPVVYEAVPVTLFRAKTERTRLTVGPAAGAGAGVAGLPRPPQVGFFGRDETLLALDRAFDGHRIVVLHAYAGSGKTSTAAEFARWYAATGGLADPDGGGAVVFSSLEQYTPLSRLLNQLGEVFDPVVRANNIAWQALDDEQRRDLAVQLLGLVPVLWIWDNVEPVAGFPQPADSPWSVAEQRELAGFLQDVVATKARVLLTSRRDEHGWLGELAARVVLPAMPMRERIQLTQALAERHGHRIGEVQDWRPLLRYTAGNPLTITVVVGQALRQGITSRGEIEGFVARLRAGESDLDDDEPEGRSRSLGASLGYGLASAFTGAERAQLAVLYLFQDTVDVDALVYMGGQGNPHRLPELAGLTRETGLALLDRAAGIGLLTPIGGGYYTIHPALPWYFRHLHHTTTDGDRTGQVEAAYTTAVADLGDYYWRLFNEGRHEAIGVLRLEEANLLHARTLARRAGRWGDVIGCMQGLRNLYAQLGRGGEWARLVEELVPNLVDPATGGPLTGRDEQWGLLTDYRISLAIDARDWAIAERLQRASLTASREQAADALTVYPDRLTKIHHNRIRALAAAEHGLGDILREQHNPDCLTHYEQAADLCRRIGARRDEATVEFNLGAAHLDIPELRDLDRAEHWYRRRLDLLDEHDRLGRAKTTMQLGRVAYERFVDARKADAPGHVLLEHLNTAAAAYHQALDSLPTDAVTDRAAIHNQLGAVDASAGAYDTAFAHYQQAIRESEGAGDTYRAGQIRFNVAFMFEQAGRRDDALLYARAALRDFEPYGANAATNIDDTRRLIALLERAADQAQA